MLFSVFALEIVRKGCQRDFTAEISREQRKKPNGRRRQHGKTRTMPPSFFIMAAVSTLSSNAQIGH